MAVWQQVRVSLLLKSVAVLVVYGWLTRPNCHTTRLLVLLASFVLGRMGVLFSCKELGWTRIHGLVLQLKKVG